MRRNFDVIVIGAGIAGSATAYYLAKLKQRVLLLDKSFPCAGSTGRCIGGIRAQFTHELTIRLMIENIEIFRNLSCELSCDIEWFPGGYLLLAHSDERERIYLQAMTIQRQYGINVNYLTPEDCRRIVPGLDITDLRGGAYCPTDGQANPFRTTYGFINGMKRLGGTLLAYNHVVEFGLHRTGPVEVKTRRGDHFSASSVVLATGPWLAETGRLLGLSIPVFAERHESLVTEAVERQFDPMLVDYRADGCYFVQNYGTGHFIGCYTPLPNVPGLDTTASAEFLTEMPRRMIRLVPGLRTVKVMRHWAGSYEMTPDGNPIVGCTAVKGVYVIGGLCGHGFMLGPALGRHLAELVVTGRSTIDLSEFDLYRPYERAEELK